MKVKQTRSEGSACSGLRVGSARPDLLVPQQSESTEQPASRGSVNQSQISEKNSIKKEAGMG